MTSCPCGKQYLRPENMGKFIVNVCDDCNLTYMSDDNLREMGNKCGFCQSELEKTVVGDNHIGHKCSACGRVFVSESAAVIEY